MSGLSISVRSNADAIAMQFRDAARDMQGQALVRALNKTADQVKVAASREVRAVGYKLKASVIKDAMRVVRASTGSLRSAVVGRGRPVPLLKYSARATAKGVSVDVLKGRKLIAGAFIATMPSGHRGVFVREENARHKKVKKNGRVRWHGLPIRELFGPSVPDGMVNKTVQDAVVAFINERFPAILEHEHRWLQRRLRGVTQ